MCSLKITILSLEDLAYSSVHSTWIVLVLDLLIDCVHCDPGSFCLHCTLESLFYLCLTCILYNTLLWAHLQVWGFNFFSFSVWWPESCVDWTESRFLTKLDTCDGRHLEVGWRSHASCQLLCKINTDTHTGPPCHSWGIADARGQNWACDILNQSEENP